MDETAVEIVDRSTLDMVKLCLLSLHQNELLIPVCAPVPNDERIDVEWRDLGLICTFDDKDALFHQANEPSFTLCYTEDKNMWKAFADAFAGAIKTKMSDVSKFIDPAMFLT